MTDPTTPILTAETVKQSNILSNPVLAALGVLMGAVGGYLAHGGRPTQADVATIVPAAVVFATMAWRAWVAHHNADKANRIAANPANTAVSLK